MSPWLFNVYIDVLVDQGGDRRPQDGPHPVDLSREERAWVSMGVKRGRGSVWVGVKGRV